MRLLSHRAWRQERRGLDSVLSAIGQVTLQARRPSLVAKKRAERRVMKTVYIVAIGIAGLSAMIAVAANGQMGTTASSDALKVESVVDAAGNLHVPNDYRTTYQFLGSWA